MFLFKQKEENNDALNFIEEFNSTKVSVDPETMIKRISRTDGSGKVIKEVFVDTNDRILKMVERRDGDNVKETRFEEDGKTVREVKQFAVDDESILLRHTTYSKDEPPIVKDYSRDGVLIKYHEIKKMPITDSGSYITYSYVKLFDEKTGLLTVEKDDTQLSFKKEKIFL